MSTIIMSYNRIIDGHVIPCPQQAGESENLDICQKCPRNRGFVESSDYKWVRCQPL